MNYCELKLNDVANGPGVRVSLFVSGCTHYCKGCFNQVSWDFNAGYVFDDTIIEKILNALEPVYINGLTLLGGEPFHPKNQLPLLPLVKKVKEKYPKKDIWVFTGYLYDKEIIDDMSKKYDYTLDLLRHIDVIVDGKFEIEKKDLTLKFKGSSNQRTIDVKESLKKNEVVLLF